MRRWRILPGVQSHSQVNEPAIRCKEGSLGSSQIELGKVAPQELTHIRSEIMLHSELHHPNIIGFVDWWRKDAQVFMVLELAEKGSLFSYLNSHHPLSNEEIRSFMIDTCKAIQKVHEIGYVHRDIKPENLLLDNDKRIKLCDFGYCSNKSDKSR